MLRQCNAMLLYVKKENNVVLLTCIFPFPVTRDQILIVNEKTYKSSFCIRLIGIMDYHYLTFLGLVLSKT